VAELDLLLAANLSPEAAGEFQTALQHSETLKTFAAMKRQPTLETMRAEMSVDSNLAGPGSNASDSRDLA
jgi:hypothetical protein